MPTPREDTPVDPQAIAAEPRPLHGVDRLGALPARADIRAFATESVRVAAGLTRVAFGMSNVEPAPRDKRFADPAWSDNPIYQRWAQAYLVWAESVERFASSPHLQSDWRRGMRVRAAADADRRRRAPRATCWSATRPRSSARSTPAARACCAAGATPRATSSATAGCPRAWTRAVHGRQEPRGHARRGHPPRGHVRAARVPAVDHAGARAPAADDSAAGQQALLPRPRARPQPDRVFRRRRHPLLHAWCGATRAPSTATGASTTTSPPSCARSRSMRDGFRLAEVRRCSAPAPAGSRPG